MVSVLHGLRCSRENLTRRKDAPAYHGYGHCHRDAIPVLRCLELVKFLIYLGFRVRPSGAAVFLPHEHLCTIVIVCSYRSTGSFLK